MLYTIRKIRKNGSTTNKNIIVKNITIENIIHESLIK